MCVLLVLIVLTATFSYAQKSNTIIPIEDIQSKTITITNGIQKDMLAYKHWTGTHTPEAFKVFVNKEEVAQGSTITIPAEIKTVDLTFDYSFAKGMYKGSKTVSYQLNNNITQASITFSWKDDNKIMIDNGTKI